MNWDLTYLFKTEEDFNKSLEALKVIVEKLGTFKGELGKEDKFKEYYLLIKKFELDASKTYQYAHLKSDLNKKDVNNASNVQKCQMLLHHLQELTSFEEPELLALGKEKVLGFVKNNPELKEFEFGFQKTFRNAEHILDDHSEKLLSRFAPLQGRGGELYSALAVADGNPEEITYADGTKTNVTQGNWSSLIEHSKCEEDRKKIFEAIFNKYEVNKNTYAAIYETNLLTNKANAENRNFDSILDSYLFRNNIPTSVYMNLVNVANSENASLKKYLKLRQEYLGLSEYHTYDRFLELASSSKTYSYEEAKKLFFASITSMPKSFQDKAHDVLKDGFVDVMEKDGKRSGAYSSGQPNLHPYILLNYSSTLDDVFTVAHEAGHSIHSMFSTEAQPVMLQDYTIFVAEIASTFNEHMLLDYFMKSNETTKEEKIMLLQKAIDSIMSTFYRQTLFAEYELEASKLVENDQPINHEVLSKIMIDLYQKYYGLDITKEQVKQYVWAYIPHLFYTPFYVYQYATSFAASFKLYKDIRNNVEGSYDRYLGLLKSGGSKYPIEQAREAGVDFTKPETFMAVVERMNELVAELEALLK